METTTNKEKLLGKTPVELQEIVAQLGFPKFTAAQIARWLYKKKVRSIEQMTDLSKHSREVLAERYCVGVSEAVHCMTSVDGTKKYLFKASDNILAKPAADKTEAVKAAGGKPTAGNECVRAAAKDEYIEAVMIPDGERATLCVSSQAGCRMGCRFCMTGRQGFHGNLSVAEILSQFYSVDESDSLTNAVFMGMGEPLDNFDNLLKVLEILTAEWGFAWSPKRITVSTIGVLPRMKEFLDKTRCHIAVSLHNPFPEERLSIMPVQKAWSITEVVRLLSKYDFSGQRRVSFEYTMFDGFNDSLRHAAALAKLLKNLESRVNLIRFHQIPDFPYKCASREKMLAFQKALNDASIVTTIRASKGEDILAACGLLAGQLR